MTVSHIPTGPFAAGRKIMRTLIPAERGVDKAISDGAKLLDSIVSGRIETGIAHDAGHVAVRSAGRWIGLLIEARDEAVRCHEALSVVRDDLGLEPVDIGCVPNKDGPAALRARAA